MLNIKIILASRSPWRKRLLKRHGIDCIVHVSDFEEKKMHAGPRALVIHNACGKARTVAKFYKDAIIVGVDTLGFLGNKIIGKPKNREDAKKMLMMLAGKTHRVISGLCVISTFNGKCFKAAVTTNVTFRKIEDEELEHYLDLGHWKGKAGAYAIQGGAKKFVKKIEGDITNVVGLPIGELKKILGKIQKSKLKCQILCHSRESRRSSPGDGNLKQKNYQFQIDPRSGRG